MSAVVLDTRALELFADAKVDNRAAQIVRDLVGGAEQAGIPVLVPMNVLTEAYRGTSADASIDRVLGATVRPITFGQAMARQAARLKHRDKLDSCHTVDASVIATSIRLGGGIVITGDPDDLKSLAREHPNVKVHSLC